MPIAGRLDQPAQVGFVSFAQCKVAGHMEHGDVRGPLGANARPLVMLGEPVSEARLEALGFADVDGIIVSVGASLQTI